MGSADERLEAQPHGLNTHLLRITEELRVTSAAWACLSFADLSNRHESIKQRGQSRVGCTVVRACLNREALAEMIKAWAVWSTAQRDNARFDEDSEQSSWLKEAFENP
ncbi:hypothetical protein ANOM_011708 [Aspergillus nomiae NRRL 13137]|uniref:Uncharacterized protein n=1 Tax=Aspergillus nomiae NRRL (strain ATCC 15546 / NRRL 13137 / CBS 260.88 / M93) TaxID=1509407 RepID=A0A0L1IKD6_ASPN3|nr:uncharacterized protein ANOM_011708 [Aspergillus nomiae NRRL 13137]KNG80024.1 hypothetical protein ANOM_011708 [Aspergillus nomiae NRRL 13137]